MADDFPIAASEHPRRHGHHASTRSPPGHHGLVTRSAAIRAGISERAWYRAIEAGQLEPAPPWCLPDVRGASDASAADPRGSARRRCAARWHRTVRPPGSGALPRPDDEFVDLILPDAHPPCIGDRGRPCIGRATCSTSSRVAQARDPHDQHPAHAVRPWRVDARRRAGRRRARRDDRRSRRRRRCGRRSGATDAAAARACRRCATRSATGCSTASRSTASSSRPCAACSSATASRRPSSTRAIGGYEVDFRIVGEPARPRVRRLGDARSLSAGSSSGTASATPTSLRWASWCCASPTERS